MPEALAKRLRTFLAQHWRDNEADLLFSTKVGKPMVRNKVPLKLQDTLKSLGIERTALHAFRHMAASELIGNGVAPSVVQCVTAIRVSLCKSTRTSLVTHSGKQWTLLLAAFWS
jgi:site-specific recombinase XerD